MSWVRRAGAIIKACLLMPDPEKPLDLGEYRGFPMQLHCTGSKFKITMKQHLTSINSFVSAIFCG